jgi:hypothetical protein
MVIRGLRWQNPRSPAQQSPNETAIEPQWNEVAHAVGWEARTDVVEVRHKMRTDDVEVAEDGGPIRKKLRDASKLTPIQHLTMGQVHVHHGEPAELSNLTDPFINSAPR